MQRMASGNTSARAEAGWREMLKGFVSRAEGVRWGQ